MRDLDPKRAAILLAPILVAILSLALAGIFIDNDRSVDHVLTSSTGQGAHRPDRQ